MLPTYVPEPYVDFDQDEPRTEMLADLKKVGGQLGRTYAIWLDGNAVTGQSVEK